MVWVVVGWRAGMSMPGNLKAASLNRKNRKKCFSSFYFVVFIFKRFSTTDASWNESPVLVYQRWAEINNVEHSRCMLSTCVWTSSKTQMDPHTHISLSHTPIPSLSVLLTAPCQALKLDLLVAWWLKPGFQGPEVTLPQPPPFLLFCLSMNSFSPFNLRALNDRRMRAGGETHTLLIPGPGQSSLKVNRGMWRSFRDHVMLARR